MQIHPIHQNANFCHHTPIRRRDENSSNTDREQSRVQLPLSTPLAMCELLFILFDVSDLVRACTALIES